MTLERTVELLLDTLKIGLEYDNDHEHMRCLDVMMGRVLDAARDYHLPVTPYVLWLTDYRIKHIKELHDDACRGHDEDEHIYWQ